jgi:hypothetical protein
LHVLVVVLHPTVPHADASVAVHSTHAPDVVLHALSCPMHSVSAVHG